MSAASDDPLDQVDATAPTAKLRKTTALVAAPPPSGSPSSTLHEWLSESLRLPASITRAQRWGRTADSPVTLELADGRTLRFEAARDIFHPERLVQTVCLQLGEEAPQLPMFSKADAQDVGIVLVRACEATAQDDERERTQDWQSGFARLCHDLDGGEYADPAKRWDALRWLAEWPEFDAYAYRLNPGSERSRPPRVVWVDDVAFVRVVDVERYVRLVLGQQIGSGALVSRMREAGWAHRRADARRPGAGRQRGSEDRVRASVFIIPHESADAPRQDVSPSVPIETHACAPARTRGTAWGHVGTHAGSPADAGKQRLGDTSGLGDTSDDPGDTARAGSEERSR